MKAYEVKYRKLFLIAAALSVIPSIGKAEIRKEVIPKDDGSTLVRHIDTVTGNYDYVISKNSAILEQGIVTAKFHNYRVFLPNGDIQRIDRDLEKDTTHFQLKRNGVTIKVGKQIDGAIYCTKYLGPGQQMQWKEQNGITSYVIKHQTGISSIVEEEGYIDTNTHYRKIKTGQKETEIKQHKDNSKYLSSTIKYADGSIEEANYLKEAGGSTGFYSSLTTFLDGTSVGFKFDPVSQSDESMEVGPQAEITISPEMALDESEH